MFQESNKIVIIDDTEADLVHLSQVFYEKGIGCKALKYDSMYSNPLKGVRALFLDINLNSAQPERDAQRNNTLKDAIVQYIHKDNGPFILIFWTSNADWVDSFIGYVNTRLNQDILDRNPYYVSKIDKTLFYDKSKELSEKVGEIFNSNTVKTLLDFTCIMSDSVWETMSNIIDIIPKGKKWGDVELFESNAKSVFAQIAKSTLGFKNAKSKPDLAIKEAIIPVFSHQIINNNNCIWREYLDNLTLTSKADDVKFPEHFNEGLLNTIFHIDNKPQLDIKKRGVVCSIDISSPEIVSIFDDKFGITYNNWFGQFLNGLKAEDRKVSELVAVEFSPACDYSQNKSRTNKYMLGVILPYDIYESKMLDEEKRLKMKIGNYAYILPYKFCIKANNVCVCLNLNYTFTVSQSIAEKLFSKSLFCFKKEIMDMIGNKYASHISRIGVTSF